MSIADKLPWRIQTFLGFRPRKTNYDSIENVLKLSEERLPINAYKKVWDGYEVKMKDPSGFFNQKKHIWSSEIYHNMAKAVFNCWS